MAEKSNQLFLFCKTICFPPDEDEGNVQEDLLSPSAVLPDIRPSATGLRARLRLQKVARSNAGLQSVKLNLTDSNAARKAELEQVHCEKSSIEDKYAQDLKLKEKEMKSRMEEVGRKKEKAAETHVQDLESKDMQIATIRDLHT